MGKKTGQRPYPNKVEPRKINAQKIQDLLDSEDTSYHDKIQYFKLLQLMSWE